MFIKTCRRCFITVGLLFLSVSESVSTLAWNQLPLPTDAPQVAAPGEIQIDLGIKFLSHKNFPFSQFSETFSRNVLSMPTIGVNIGVSKRVEIQLTYELLFVEEEELLLKERWKSGDLDFFTKLELLKERRHLPGIGVKFGAKLPNASDTHRVGTDETDLAFSLLLGKTIASAMISANLSVLILGNPFRNATQDDLFGYGVACAILWGPHMTSVIEVAGQTLGMSHNEEAVARFYLLFEDGALTWNFGGRVGLLDNTENWGLSGGVRWTFDGLARWTSEE